MSDTPFTNLPEKEALLQPVTNKPATLRALLKQKRDHNESLAVPGAFNAISAKILEANGFECAYVSGAGTNNGVGGYPDIGFMTADEMARQAGYISRAITIPTIADADNGFGEAVNAFRTVQMYEREGVSGLHIEDQISPKRCGHLAGKQVISGEHMSEKIAAAAAARTNTDFLIIARTDAKAVYDYDEALKRAVTYLDAGADMIFPEALETAEEFERFAKDLRSHNNNAMLLANMTEFGKTPYLSLQEFACFGYNMVIYPMTAFRVMMHAVDNAYQQLKQEGTQTGFLDRMTPRKELYELIHYEAYEQLDSNLATQFSTASSKQ